MQYVCLIYQGTTPLPGSDEWNAMSGEEQQQIYADPPYLFLYAIYNIYGMRRNIQMTPRTDERIIVAHIRRA